MTLSLTDQSKAQMRIPLPAAAWLKAVLAGDKQHALASAGYGVREMLLQRLVTSVLAQVVLWLLEPIAATGLGLAGGTAVLFCCWF